MERIPEVKGSMIGIQEILIAPIKKELLLTGLELGVFDHLNQPKSAEFVAEVLNTRPGNTKLLLDGLTACGLVEKKEGLYSNTQNSLEFLSQNSSTFLGTMIINQNRIDEQTIPKISSLVKEGPPDVIPETEMNSEEMCLQFTEDTAAGERAGIAQNIVKHISTLPEFTSFRKMLDLGGGPGLNSIAIIASHDKMEGIVFDRSEIVKITKRYIGDYGLSDRMGVIGGDYLQDPIGEGYDLVLASDNLYYPKEQVDHVVKKIYDSLNPNGVFFSIHAVLTDEGTKSEALMLGMLLEELSGTGKIPDQDLFAGSMLKAGFKSVQSKTVLSTWGPFGVDIGRK
jgi:predicted O-methyltransferase YrrM